MICSLPVQVFPSRMSNSGHIHILSSMFIGLVMLYQIKDRLLPLYSYVHILRTTITLQYERLWVQCVGIPCWNLEERLQGWCWPCIQIISSSTVIVNLDKSKLSFITHSQNNSMIYQLNPSLLVYTSRICNESFENDITAYNSNNNVFSFTIISLNSSILINLLITPYNVYGGV